VRGLLKEPEAWRGTCKAEVADVEHLAMVWKSLSESSQDAFLPHVIDRVTINRCSGAVVVCLQLGCVRRLTDDVKQ